MSQEWATIPQMVFAHAQATPDRCVMKMKRLGAYRDIPWRDLATQVENIALGLIDLGVKPGDRVGILSENRPEWALADLAILCAGGVTVPIYTTLTAQEIEYVLRDAGVEIIFISTPEAMAKVLSFQKAMDLKVVLFDAPYRVSGPRIWWLGELIGLGQTSGPSARVSLSQRIAGAQPEALASIIYTSGTTGPPKGVMLTHGNFLSNCRAIHEVMPIGADDSTLSFLPLSHVFERTAGYYFVLYVGGRIAYAEGLETVPANLLEIRPTLLTGVPRFYEKTVERIREAVRSAPAIRRWIFSWALRVGLRRTKILLENRPLPPIVSLTHRIADRLVFSKLRARLGGRLRFCISGGAPLSKEIAEFFYAAGILILEGYGLTETSPVITVNRPTQFRFGSVGVSLPGVEVKIAPDGEILTRGPHVMRGYFNKPEATAEAIDPEGWFRTGDIGTLNPEGFLTITDRKKDLIKTSGGKMVAPQNLENALKSDPWITDCVVIGDRRKFLTVLIVPNILKLEEFAEKQTLPAGDPEALLKTPQVVNLLWERVEAVNRTLAPFEQLKKMTLLAEPFTLASGELTPTLKIKRKVIGERYAAQIEAMYRDV